MEMEKANSVKSLQTMSTEMRTLQEKLEVKEFGPYQTGVEIKQQAPDRGRQCTGLFHEAGLLKNHGVF